MFRSLLLARCKKVFLNFNDGKIKLFSEGLKKLSISKSIIENSRSFHRSSICCDLMEFFDDSKNWGEEEVKSGRAWTIDELRIKSNSDLHKLWFVLYKEKNMLLTMEHAAKEEVELFPSPERIDKVEISMENLEAVVRERNEAYYLLETGETGERPHGWKEDEFGRFNCVPLEEHLIPMKENKKFLEEDLFPTMETVNPTVPEFLLKLSEKERFLKRIERKKQRMHIKKLFKEFPNMDMEALQEQYPDVDVYQYKKYLEEHDEL
ncbi:large ribosomal subunit protein uL29m isoform X2 [Parasteatoda tepidariorum]|uniref:large ribosomal subunit protein uL29m isoform X1 n=1 Tax=Parasteatoda tepidariorum TaxID=114398 RepID=UPI001C723702|nr:39S ribosomal protein L47, mitochondrial isoform X1 [Parasteatoda tepidariorum]XP_042908826.1 39S ribosomal protein L47, mitochondrial isoform X2 [Parasteatoda tepidariorum]